MNISKYKNYRTFIREYITEMRKSDGKYSMIYFSKKIKASDSYLKLVVSGKRTLNMEKAFLLAKAFNLTPAEKSYFITLVMENESREDFSKSYFKSLLHEKSKSDFSYVKNRQHTAIFEDRALWEIFSLIRLSGFENSVRYIKSKLRLTTSETEISSSLERLIKSGAVSVDEQGKLQAENIVIPHSYNPAKAYRTALLRAIKHIDTGILDSSYFDSFCLVLSEDQFSQIRTILEDTKSKIAKIASQKRDDKSLIAFLNLNLFSASR